MAKALHACNAHRPEDVAYAGDRATKRFNCRHRTGPNECTAGGQLLVYNAVHFKIVTQNFKMPGPRFRQRRRPRCAGENASINVVKLVYLEPK